MNSNEMEFRRLFPLEGFCPFIFTIVFTIESCKISKSSGGNYYCKGEFLYFCISFLRLLLLLSRIGDKTIIVDKTRIDTKPPNHVSPLLELGLPMQGTGSLCSDDVHALRG